MTENTSTQKPEHRDASSIMYNLCNVGANILTVCAYKNKHDLSNTVN